MCPPPLPRPQTTILISYFDSNRDDAAALEGAFRLGTPGPWGAFGGLGVDAVLGPASSGPSANAQYVLRKLKVPQVGYSATSPALSDDSLFPFFIRTPPSNAFDSVVLADLIRTLGYDRVATISGMDAYDSSSVQVFKDVALKAGVAVVESQKLARTNDVSPEVLKIMSSGTRIVLVIMTPMVMGIVIREFSRHANWKPGTGVVYIFGDQLKVGAAPSRVCVCVCVLVALEMLFGCSHFDQSVGNSTIIANVMNVRFESVLLRLKLTE